MLKNDLTPREQDIFNMLLAGKAPKEIAYELKIAYNTVITHQKNIYRKLEVQNINEFFAKFHQPESTSAKKANKRKIVLRLAMAGGILAVIFISLFVLASWKGGRVMLNSQRDYDWFLSRLLEESKEATGWYICIGEGDWSYAWLSRVFAEKQQASGNKPQIDGIYVKHLSPEVAENLEENGILKKGFYKRMMENIEGLRHLSEVQGIDFGVSYYEEDDVPKWHGHLYGNYVLRGKWVKTDAGNISVHTALEAIPSTDGEFSDMKEYFTKKIDR
jgi:DNA-binding CsgD family transcriptional regulator